jgi:uncharacterized alkaline shock family protein YloU
MEGHSHIATDVVARYARDAAVEVPGVTRVVEGVRKGVRVDGDAVELHLAVGWGSSIPELAAEVQQRVAAYLTKMADLRPARVDVVVEEVDGTP